MPEQSLTRQPSKLLQYDFDLENGKGKSTNPQLSNSGDKVHQQILRIRRQQQRFTNRSLSKSQLKNHQMKSEKKPQNLKLSIKQYQAKNRFALVNDLNQTIQQNIKPLVINTQYSPANLENSNMENSSTSSKQETEETKVAHTKYQMTALSRFGNTQYDSILQQDMNKYENKIFGMLLNA